MVAPMHPVRSLVSSGGSVAQPFLPIPLPTTRILVLHSRTYSRTRHSMYHQPRIIRTALCLCIAIPVIVALVMISCDGPVTAPQTTVDYLSRGSTGLPLLAHPKPVIIAQMSVQHKCQCNERDRHKVTLPSSRQMPVQPTQNEIYAALLLRWLSPSRRMLSAAL